MTDNSMACYGCNRFMSCDEIVPICQSCAMLLTEEQCEAMIAAIKRQDTRGAKAIYRRAVVADKKRSGRFPKSTG